MRLYSRVGATALDHDGQHYTAEPDGSFLLPEEVADAIGRFHVGGKPLWEDEVGRQARLISEEDARRRDPRTLLDAVERITHLADSSTQAAQPSLSLPDPSSWTPEMVRQFKERWDAFTAPPPAVPDPAADTAGDPESSPGGVDEGDDPGVGPTTATIRAWAKEAGIDVPARGKLPQAVLDAYNAPGVRTAAV